MNKEDLDKFKQWLEGQDMPVSTIRNYMYNVQRLPPELLSDENAISKYIENSGKKGTTINAWFAAAAAFIRFKTGKRPSFNYVKVRNKEKEAPTPDELAKLLKAIKKPVIRDMVILSTQTGLRHSAILNMKVGWVDLENNTIRVPAKVEGNKMKKRFPTFFRADAKALLQKRIWQKNNNAFVFTIPVKNKINWVNRNLKKYCKAAGIDYYSFHCFRYYFASEYKGDPLIGTQLMGQSDPKQFMRYNKKRIAELRKDYEKGTKDA